ncbi:hypothetical protein [Devosia sp. DBB001]|nr:hypothetical protein [Devosia sp. DBB001]
MFPPATIKDAIGCSPVQNFPTGPPLASTLAAMRLEGDR